MCHGKITLLSHLLKVTWHPPAMWVILFSLEKKRTETSRRALHRAIYSQGHYHSSGHFAHRILLFRSLWLSFGFHFWFVAKVYYKWKWEVCTLTHSVENVHERALRNNDVDGIKSNNNNFALFQMNSLSKPSKTSINYLKTEFFVSALEI